MSSLRITLTIFAIGFIGSANAGCTSKSLQQLIKTEVTVGTDYIFEATDKFTLALRTFEDDNVETWPDSAPMAEVLKELGVLSAKGTGGSAQQVLQAQQAGGAILYLQAENGNLRIAKQGNKQELDKAKATYKKNIVSLWKSMLEAKYGANDCLDVTDVQNITLPYDDPQKYKLRFQQQNQAHATYAKGHGRLSNSNVTVNMGWSLDYYSVPSDRASGTTPPLHTIRSGVLYAKPCNDTSTPTTGAPWLKLTSRTSLTEPRHYPVAGGVSFVPHGENDVLYKANGIKSGIAYSVVNQDSSVASCECASLKNAHRARKCCAGSSRI